MTVQTLTRPDKAEVIAKAFYRAADALQFNRQEIHDLLGVSLPTVSRHLASLHDGDSVELDPKKTEIALVFLRIYRSLMAVVGGNDATARAWFDAHNSYLRGKPRDLIKSIQGLINVAEYLDGMRGKI